MRRRVTGGRGRPLVLVFPEGIHVLVSAVEDVRQEANGSRIILTGGRELENLVNTPASDILRMLHR